MIFDDEDNKRPAVLSAKNCAQAVVIHVVLFGVLYLVALINFTPKDKTEDIQFFDPVFEAPPDEVAPEPKPEPEPPKQEPKPVKQSDPPPEVEEHVDALEKVEKKPEKTKIKEKKPEKKVEEKKPDKPKKTQEQIKKEKEEARKERLKKMREGAKVVKNPKPPPVAGTGQKLDPNWEKLLKQGYKPSDHTELAPSMEALCYSLIRNAFYDKWDRPPWTDTLREMVLRVWFGPGGRVVNFKLEKSSGDPKADVTVINAARAVRIVQGLSPDFISAKKKAGVPIRFKVTPQ